MPQRCLQTIFPSKLRYHGLDIFTFSTFSLKSKALNGKLKIKWSNGFVLIQHTHNNVESKCHSVVCKQFFHRHQNLSDVRFLQESSVWLRSHHNWSPLFKSCGCPSTQVCTFITFIQIVLPWTLQTFLSHFSVFAQSLHSHF